MADRPTKATLIAAGPTERNGGFLHELAFLIILVTVAVRPFLGEMPLRTSPIVQGQAVQSQDAAGHQLAPAVDRGELARVTFAMLLLGAVALWLAGDAIRGRLRLRHRYLGLMILVLAAVLLASALAASNKRAALTGMAEQASMILAAYAAAHLLVGRRRMVILLMVLAAVGTTLGIKAFYQFFVEVPQRTADFFAYRSQQMEQLGVTPGTPQAIALENRVKDQSATGYFGLANILASMFIVLMLAAVGLAADKLQRAKELRKAWTRRKGEIHLPAIAAALSALAALVVVAAVPLTRSRAGIAFAVLAVVAFGIIFRLRQSLAGHWRKALAITALVLGLTMAAVVAYGLHHDGLPSKSMTFRWYYWTASAQIAAQHPVLGVGPDNFPSAYLAHRRPAAEEAVKMPHNLAAHALSEYGLVGGLAYLGVIVMVLVLICRSPRSKGLDESAYQPQAINTKPIRSKVLWPFVLVVAGVALGRYCLGSVEDNIVIIMSEVALPAATLAAALALWAWLGRGDADPAKSHDAAAQGVASGLPLRAIRVAIGCGLAGFILHNFTEFGLFAAAPATVFWIAAGAALAFAPSGDLILGRSRWAAVGGAGAALLAVGVFVWYPVVARTPLAHDAAGAYHRGYLDKAQGFAVEAAQVDRLDPLAAADAARTYMPSDMDAAHRWAMEAVRRDPSNPSWLQMAAETAWFAAWPDVYVYGWQSGPVAPQAVKQWEAQLAKQRHPLLLSRLAQAHYQQRQFPQAIALLQEAVEKHDVPMLHVLMGNSLMLAGDEQAARREWAIAAGQTRTDPAASRPGGSRDQGGGMDEAVSLMGRAVEMNPQDIRLRIAFARMLCWAGRMDQCRSQIEQAMAVQKALSPESIERFSPPELVEIDLLMGRAMLAERAAAGQNDQ